MTQEEGEKKAKELKIMHMETSAKAGHNVKLLFRKIAQMLPGMENVETQSTQMIDVSIQPNENESSCNC